MKSRTFIHHTWECWGTKIQQREQHLSINNAKRAVSYFCDVYSASSLLIINYFSYFFSLFVILYQNYCETRKIIIFLGWIDGQSLARGCMLHLVIHLKIATIRTTNLNSPLHCLCVWLFIGLVCFPFRIVRTADTNIKCVYIFQISQRWEKQIYLSLI